MTFRPSSLSRISANDRFKSKRGDWLSVGVIAAVFFHVSLFAFYPEVRAADVRRPDEVRLVVHRPPAVDMPQPPQQVDRPPPPRVAAVQLDEGPDPYRFIPPGPARPKQLPPPRPGARPEDEPSYIPRDVEPRLRNREELLRALHRRYPAALRQAGIGGTVGLYVYVAETGDVMKAELLRSSGYVPFDSVARNVALDAVFSPARRRDEPIGVWIILPIAFATP